MSTTDTTDQVIRKLRSTDKPALSAADLAEELGVSVRTINNHVTTLVEENRIESTQIGNAQAYYVSSSDLPAHKKPDHTCTRCGREIRGGDHAKIEEDRYFQGQNLEPEVADFYIVCRFCYEDFINWMYNDIASIGDYPFVHSWDIPEEQIEEVREDPDIQSRPKTDYLDDEELNLYETIRELVENEDEWVERNEVMSAATDGDIDKIKEIKTTKVLNKLLQIGLVQSSWKGIRLAK